MEGLDQRTFDEIREVIYQKSGIALADSKLTLVAARINKRMRKLQIENAKDYLAVVLNDATGEEVVQLLDVISTNVTNFFREDDHFYFMAQEIRRWVEEGQRKVRIWCAASSTGEEPYTMAMVLDGAINISTVDTKILATDISTRVLDIAKAGVYPEDKIIKVPDKYRAKSFVKVSEEGGVKQMQVASHLRKLISFHRLNLNEPPFPMKGPMDFVFCRNVMIYFDDVVRKRLIEDIYRLLKPGGYLCVGYSESLAGIMGNFQMIRPSVYVK